MEYKIGDKVIVKDGEKSYVVEITNKYNMKYIISYDGIRLFDKTDVYFEITDIECKIEAGPCPCGPKGEEGVKKEYLEENKFKIGDSVLVKTFSDNKKEAIIEKEIEHYGEEWFKVRDKNKENCFYVVRYEDMEKIEEVEENKYLKTWEAIKALEEGYNIKHKDWINNQYIYKNKEGQIISNRVGPVEIDNLDNEWEIYEEPKKEIPKEFEGLMYILASINNLDCNQSDCDSCPMGIDNCNKLDEVFFSMKEKYNF